MGGESMESKTSRALNLLVYGEGWSRGRCLMGVGVGEGVKVRFGMTKGDGLVGGGGSRESVGKGVVVLGRD